MEQGERPVLHHQWQWMCGDPEVAGLGMLHGDCTCAISTSGPKPTITGSFNLPQPSVVLVQCVSP